MQVLHAEQVIARRYFYPGCHRMMPYKAFQPNAGMWLPETEKLLTKVLVLPTGRQLTEDDVVRICNLLKYITENAGAISSRILERKYIPRLETRFATLSPA